MLNNHIELKVNIKSEFKALQDLFIASAIFISSAFLVLFYLEMEIIFYVLIGFYFFLYFLPVIIIHSNYEKYNKNKLLILGDKEMALGNIKIFTDEIISGKIYGTYQSINKFSYSELPYQCAYFYIEIKDKKGTIIYLTNLFSSKLMEIFKEKYPDIILEKNITSFPLI